MDACETIWCCLTCSAKFTFGAIMMKKSTLHCPKCDSENIHPADGEATNLNEYHGEIGTKQ